MDMVADEVSMFDLIWSLGVVREEEVVSKMFVIRRKKIAIIID